MLLKKLFIQSVLCMIIFTGFANANTIENAFGVGLGLPYGGIGFNYELSFNDYIAPTIGIGYLKQNLGWNTGIRFYYPDRESKFRGRITAIYGTNTVLEQRYYNHRSDYKTDTGFSGGIGFNWRFCKTLAFDTDIFFGNPDLPEGYEESGSDIKYSLGISFRW